MPFRLALALLVQSPQQWAAVSPSALHHTLRTRFPAIVGMTVAAGESADTEEPASGQENATASPEHLWRAAAPGLRLFGAIDFFQRKLKAPTDAASGWQAALSHRYSFLPLTYSVKEGPCMTAANC